MASIFQKHNIIFLSGVVLVLAITYLLFGQSLEYPFLNFDDDYWISQNPGIRELSWSNIRFLFTEDTRDFRYFPITYLSFAIDYHFFGLDPRYFHLTNILLHSANIVLVALLVFKLFGKRIAALITAAFFAIHPLQVEAVVWAMSRKNVLFFFFFLLSLLSYLAYFQYLGKHYSKAALFLLLSIVLYLISGMAKTTAITLPAVLLLIDHLLDEPRSSTLISFAKRHLPSKLLYIPPAVFLFLMNGRRSELSPFHADYNFSWLDWILIPGHNTFFYIYKTLIPTKLAVFYPYINADFPSPRHYVFTVLTFIVVALAFFTWKRYRNVFWGSMYFLITISPMAFSVLLTSDVPILTADRYLYQSAPGIFLLLGLGIDHIWHMPGESQLPSRMVLLLILSSILTGVWFVSDKQVKTWRDTITVFENEVNHYPSDAFYRYLAFEYEETGQSNKAFTALALGESAPLQFYFSKILIHQYKLFVLYSQKGDIRTAALHLENAIESVPNHMEPFSAKTPFAYFYLAHLYEISGDSTKVQEYKSKAEMLLKIPLEVLKYFSINIIGRIWAASYIL